MYIFIILSATIIRKGADKMDAAFVRERITKLRMQKGVSEYQMSYDLGHSRGYINNISSGKSLPSLAELFAICEYFEVSLSDFFNENVANPKLTTQVIYDLEQLDEDDLALIHKNIARLLRK